jgi:hypothetical protein
MARSGRLSLESVDRWVPTTDPDYGRLRDLVSGIPIITAEDFRPNGAPPKLRAKYLRMAPAVNKLMYQLYEKDNIIIMPTEKAKQIKGVHFSSTHWALKKGKVWGRPIGDASSSEEGTSPLNSERVKELVKEMWGDIEHPTVEILSAMVQRQAVRVGWENLMLWKMDLRGAFTLLFVKGDSVQKLAFELTDGLTMLYITGMFGWTGMPFAFQVVTRILVRIINSEL